MKIIIEIPKDTYEECQGHIYFPDTGEELFTAVKNGTPLDNVKAEIEKMPTDYCGGYIGLDKKEVLQILDNIGKESEEE